MERLRLESSRIFVCPYALESEGRPLGLRSELKADNPFIVFVLSFMASLKWAMLAFCSLCCGLW